MAKISISRYHDFSAGHRVVGHEGKCRGLHGHNYRVHFVCEAPELDRLGRIIDFSVVKSRLCEWLELHWDHKMILWYKDPVAEMLYQRDNLEVCSAMQSIVTVLFNPTAENMADHLLHIVAPKQLEGTGVMCTRVVVEETRKCSASAEL